MGNLCNASPEILLLDSYGKFNNYFYLECIIHGKASMNTCWCHSIDKGNAELVVGISSGRHIEKVAGTRIRLTVYLAIIYPSRNM